MTLLSRTSCRAALIAASLFAGGAVLAQTGHAATVLVATATAHDTQAAAVAKFAQLLTKYSHGRLQGSARPGGALGSNVQMVAGIRSGAIQAMITPAGIIASVVPEVALFDLPFLLPHAPAKMTAFCEQSKAVAEMKKLADKKGIHILAFHGIGPSSFLTKFPVHTLADLRGKKFGTTIPSPLRIAAYQDWGLVPRAIGFLELYTALQQGTVVATDNPPDVIYRMKAWEVAKYYTITQHFPLVDILMVSKIWYDGLPKDLKGAVNKAAKETVAFADAAYTKSQRTSLAALRKAIHVTTMPPAQIQKMKELAHKGVWKKMENSPRFGPMVKLLKEDAARFAGR